MLNNLLYIAWQPNEYLVRFGSMGIRWYGMCWLVGFAVAYFLMRWLFKRHKIPVEKFEPMFMYVFLGAFIGARLGHCFFYEPEDFFDSWQHFVEIFLPIKFLAGGGWKFVGYQGLASHGGVIGLLVGLYLYIKRTKLNTWVVLDFMGFYDVDTYPRHPGQLYEAIAYFVFFWVIFLIYRKYPKKVGTGLYFGLCLALIFTFRFFIEYTKEVQVDFEAGLPIDMGQILSIPFIALGIWSVMRSRGKEYNA